MKGQGRLRQVPIDDATLIQQLQLSFQFKSGSDMNERDEDLGSELDKVELHRPNKLGKEGLVPWKRASNKILDKLGY